MIDSFAINEYKYRDDDYFNFLTRLEQNQKEQRIIIFGEHLSNVSRFWFSVDLTCAPEKITHSAHLNVQIERRIDDHMLQCVVDTVSVFLQYRNDDDDDIL